MQPVRIGDLIEVGPGRPFLLVAGPCVLEGPDMAHLVAAELGAICARLGISFVFKASFDKANRTSLEAYRGPGLEEGLRLLAEVKARHGVAVVSDVHEPSQVDRAAQVLDLLQIPAFLCRQTDLLVAAARTGRPVAVKKGQFLSPWDMGYVRDKVHGAGGAGRLLLMERGTSFGYNNLVVDLRSFAVMRGLGCPVIFDATHSVQLPGGAGGSSGGQREFIAPLARGAVAAGVDGLFMEVHPDPASARCDGPNSMPLAEVEAMLTRLLRIREAARDHGDANPF